MIQVKGKGDMVTYFLEGYPPETGGTEDEIVTAQSEGHGDDVFSAPEAEHELLVGETNV